MPNGCHLQCCLHYLHPFVAGTPPSDPILHHAFTIPMPDVDIRQVDQREVYCRHRSSIAVNHPTLILNRHLAFDISSCRYISSSSSSIHHCCRIADTHSILAAIRLHCSHHQLQLQHTNIYNHIISSSMGMLTYLSVSSIHLMLSTYDAF